MIGDETIEFAGWVQGDDLALVCCDKTLGLILTDMGSQWMVMNKWFNLCFVNIIGFCMGNRL